MKVLLSEEKLCNLISECVEMALSEVNQSQLYDFVNPRTVELYNYIKDGKSDFINPKIIKDAWVIHFTDDGDKLQNAHGFTFGYNDFDDLPNTADGRDYPENPEKGFNFAFLLSRPSELYMSSYDAFIFKASGILCKHSKEFISGGKPMEQFIFWCDDTDLSEYYRITRETTRFNFKIYNDYYVKKNNSEPLKTVNQFGFYTEMFPSMKAAIKGVIEDIKGNGVPVKRLNIQKDTDSFL